MDKEIRRSSLAQLKFLLRLIDNPNHVTSANTKSSGATVAQLSRKKWVEPFGKVKGRLRWHLTVEFSDHDVKVIREIVAMHG